MKKQTQKISKAISSFNIVQQLRNKEKYHRCDKNNLVTDLESGELFCSKCGLVISEKISDTSPDRTFLDNSNKIRTGTMTSLTKHDQGLSTIINPLDRDSAGHPLSSSIKYSINRLRILDSRSRIINSNDKNLQVALNELLKMKDKLALSDAIVEKAAFIYRKILEKGLVRGRTISVMIAAALYVACRESGTPRTINEITKSINIKRKLFTSCYRLIVRELNLKMPVVDSVSHVTKIANNVGLSEQTKRIAIKILKKAEQEKILAGKDPIGMAATALYIATIKIGHNITQKNIASAAGTTEVTIRNRYKNLKEIEI